MNARLKAALKVIGVGAVIVAAVGIGYLSASRAGSKAATSGYSTGVGTSMRSSGLAVAPQAPTQESAVSADTAVPGANAKAAATADRLIVSTAAMSVRTDSLDKAIASVRSIATAAGGEISNLVVSNGEDQPGPVPMSGAPAGVQSAPTPGQATITLRIPANKLGDVQDKVVALGTVTSQSASEDDVTQQHVDMAARLKNLQAEEARLRDFLSKATKISDMLQIETELSRVRGEIESMQAQLAYLERQAAMATLTVTFFEPGAIVRPGRADWGFAEAVTRGFQAAASLLGTLITITIASAPLLVLALLVWGAVRLVRRRRRLKPDTPATDAEA